MIKSKKQMYIIVSSFAVILMLFTTTYAFFNYTRTGSANTIRTGRISFNTSQSNTLNLTNVFPMSATDAGNANLDAVSVRIWGDTTYTDGEEFEISIVDVNNTIGSGQSAKTIPINYIASYSATPVQSGDPNVIGTNSDSYFTARGQSSPVYQLSATGEATNGEQVLIGYIPSGGAGVDGTLTIKAYLDSSKIAISDTYPAEETDTNSDGYIDGTPASFGEGKTVLTTTEWNALQNTQTPLSFKIKAESNEGTWVERKATDSSCFTTVVSNNEVTITDYDVSCGGTDIVIPSTINGNNVTIIDTNAFNGSKLSYYYNKKLTSVILPNTINEIRYAAFGDNQINGTIIIPNGVTLIGHGAFQNNQISGELIIPNSVTSIDSNAFEHNQLTSVILGNNVNTIETAAFVYNQIESVLIPNSVSLMKCSAFAAQNNNIITQITYEDTSFSCTN